MRGSPPLGGSRWCPLAPVGEWQVFMKQRNGVHRGLRAMRLFEGTAKDPGSWERR